MKFEKFQIHNAADEDLGFLFDTQDEAVTQARHLEGPVCVVALIFEFTDSELVWTSDGSTVWPPDGEATVTCGDFVPADGDPGHCANCGEYDTDH